MTAATKLPLHPRSRPSGWPTDRRSKCEQVDGVYFIWHPERKPQVYDAVKNTWKEVQ